MQQAFAILDPGGNATVAEAMEKRGQISARPNSAPKADVERVKARVEAIGLDWHVASKNAGLSYATGYRLLRCEASVGKLRQLEEWVIKEESRRKMPSRPSASEQDAMLAEWTDLGRDLSAVDPQHFVRVLEGLRDVVEANKRIQSALRKMLSPTTNK